VPAGRQGRRSTPVAPRDESLRPGRGNPAARVLAGARKSRGPALGARMAATQLLGRSVFVRELLPQDLKVELDELSVEGRPRRSRTISARWSAARPRPASSTASAAGAWQSEMQHHRTKAIEAPSWLVARRRRPRRGPRGARTSSTAGATRWRTTSAADRRSLCVRAPAKARRSARPLRGQRSVTASTVGSDVRLNKYLSESGGVVSRPRGQDALISEGSRHRQWRARGCSAPRSATDDDVTGSTAIRSAPPARRCGRSTWPLKQAGGHHLHGPSATSPATSSTSSIIPRRVFSDRSPRQGLRGPDPAHERRRHRQRGAARRAQTTRRNTSFAVDHAITPSFLDHMARGSPAVRRDDAALQGHRARCEGLQDHPEPGASTVRSAGCARRSATRSRRCRRGPDHAHPPRPATARPLAPADAAGDSRRCCRKSRPAQGQGQGQGPGALRSKAHRHPGDGANRRGATRQRGRR